MDDNNQIKLQAIEFDPFAGPVIEKIVPVIQPQAEIWTSCAIGGEAASLSYNESVSLTLTGALEVKKLQEAIIGVVQRHDALRSGFSPSGTELCIFQENTPDIQFEDLSGFNEAEQADKIEVFLKLDASSTFNLLTGPLFRAAIFKLGDNKHHLTLTAHHIVCDGWSMSVIMQEISALYSAAPGVSNRTLEPAPSFADYAVSQNAYQLSTDYQRVENYWLNQFKNDVPVLDLPVDFPRPEIKTYKSRRDDFKISPDLVKALREMGAKAGCSLVSTMLTAFEVFLYKITSQTEIVLGVPAAGQASEGNYKLVGHCVNMLPIRSSHDGNMSFLEHLKIRKSKILDAYEHQHFTFGTLLQKIGIARDASRVPLIPVVFNLDIGLDEGVNFEGLSHDLTINKREYENFEIFLNASGSGNDLTFEWSYNTQLFTAERISQMMSDMLSVFQEVSENPEILLKHIHTESIRNHLRELELWNDTRIDFNFQPVHELFTAQAIHSPDRVAVSFEDSELTYDQLKLHSNRLANYLISTGIVAGDRIGIAVDRSANMIVALLATLKAGAAYIPLDPTYPIKRLQFMINDSEAKLLITESAFQDSFKSGIPTFLIDQESDKLLTFDTSKPSTKASPEDLAYLIYTSGTTGLPKGTKITHRNLSNFLLSMQREPGINENDKLLAVTTIAFDIAGLEIFLPLISGAEIVLANAEDIKDGRRLLDIIRSENITMMQATPSSWRMILNAGWSEKRDIKCLCGGEALTKELAHRLLACSAELWNMYGPTETTIWSTIKRVSAADELVTIGKPIANTSIYILDQYQGFVSPGNSGEICIGGQGVAPGYLNDKEKTQQQFVELQLHKEERIRLYRTGDLGKFTHEGEIVHLGRMDTQVKIRGHRIELSAIEDCLNAQPEIRESVVVAIEDGIGTKRLLAYVVPATTDRVTSRPDWKERWEDLYQRGLVSDFDKIPGERYLDRAVMQELTGRANISEEVDDWLQQAVLRIRELNPRNVIELGCGAGQLAFELAPYIDNYIASDYSKVAIDKLNEELKANSKWSAISAHCAPADDFTELRNFPADLVVLNSVVQYFPDTHYLLKVIENAIASVQQLSCIFIGDVQGKTTLEMHHAFEQFQRTNDTQNLEDFKEIFQRRLKLEDELVIDPDFFYQLNSLIPEIKSVVIQLRDGNNLNETIKYHYDVWLYLDPNLQLAEVQNTIKWHSNFGHSDIIKILTDQPGQIHQLTEVFNSRTATDFKLQYLINTLPADTPIKQIREELEKQLPGLDPHLIWNFSAKAGYKAFIQWTTNGSDGLFNVTFIPVHQTLLIPMPPVVTEPVNDLHSYSRKPYDTPGISSVKVKEIKAELGKVLPGFMIPSEIIVLNKIPLLPNGKIDRKALPEWEVKKVGKKIVLPRTDIEKLVWGIWAETFGMEEIGVYDDFFELGGHSLIAIQVMIRIEKETGKRLPLASLFTNSTIESLARMLELDAKSITWDSLVPIRPAGSKMPLYIVHGAGLNVLFFNTLAKNMDAEQPVYGLQAKGLNGIDEPFDKIEDMASFYIEEVLRQNPEGPYALAGFSFGGIIAFEMARQMKRMGKDVRMLAMFDTYAYQSGKFEPFPKRVYNNARYLLKQLFYTYTLAREDPKRTLDYKTESLKRRFIELYWKIKYGKNQEQEGFFGYSHKIDKKNEEAFENYKLEPYDGQIELFRAKKKTFYMDDFENLGWKPYALRGVNIHEIPGEHNFIFAPPNDEEFAGILQDCLNRAAESAAE